MKTIEALASGAIEQPAQHLSGLAVYLDPSDGLKPKRYAPQPAPQEPVAKVDANDDGYWADILPDRTVKVGQLLYAEAPQPAQQEPVVYLVNCTSCGEEKKVERGNHHPWCFCGSDSFDWGNSREQPAQRTFVELTDEAIWLEYQRFWPFHPAEEPTLAKDIAKFARAIESKLKAKNSP